MTYAPLRDFNNETRDGLERFQPYGELPPSCPPCDGHCHQGRKCPANTPAEACTDAGFEDEPHDPHDEPGAGTIRWLFLAVAFVAVLTAWTLKS